MNGLGKSFSRRDFLKASGVVLGTIAVPGWLPAASFSLKPSLIGAREQPAGLNELRRGLFRWRELWRRSNRPEMALTLVVTYGRVPDQAPALLPISHYYDAKRKRIENLDKDKLFLPPLDATGEWRYTDVPSSVRGQQDWPMTFARVNQAGQYLNFQGGQWVYTDRYGQAFSYFDTRKVQWVEMGPSGEVEAVVKKLGPDFSARQTKDGWGLFFVGAPEKEIGTFRNGKLEIIDGWKRVAYGAEMIEPEVGINRVRLSSPETKEDGSQGKATDYLYGGYVDAEGKGHYGWQKVKGWEKAMALADKQPHNLGPDWSSFHWFWEPMNTHHVSVVSDEELSTEPIEIVANGERLATVRVHHRGYYLDSQGQLQSVIVPQYWEIDGLDFALLSGGKWDFHSREELETLKKDPIIFGGEIRGLKGHISLITETDTDRWISGNEYFSSGNKVTEAHRIIWDAITKFNRDRQREMEAFIESGDPSIGILFPEGAVFRGDEVALELPE